LKLFVNHWPSKKHPESHRVAVAQKLRMRLRALPAGTEYIILGDLNTDFDQWSRLRTEKLDDTRGEVGLNHVLGTVTGQPERFIAYVTTHDLCGNGLPLAHYNPWVEVPERMRWSYRYRGAPHTLDHLLLAATLFDTAGFSYCCGTFRPFTWDGKLLEKDAPQRWKMKGYGKRRFHAGVGYSDHLPVRALLVRGAWACVNDSSPHRGAEPIASLPGGFEQSLDGWISCGPFSVEQDSTASASGRCCLRVSGCAQLKNGCAARVITSLPLVNASRSVTVSFSLRGEGKFSIRLRSGNGAWRYYNGPSFTPSNSARYLPVSIPRWKKVSLPFTLDMPGSPDLEIELRAGKGAAFDFRVDDVRVEGR
ncbi:MAG: hypothetical protein JXA71_18625, partial [Chitinispirillaceae bacterium]|nr:hypothetical protein [Chitinispirillaceae bacterium]